jgi:ADP-heptose:LPS heptosyltransferase
LFILDEEKPLMQEFKKILIMRPKFLGDLILATGLPAVIQRDQPQAQVWFLAEKPYAEALQHHSSVAGVLALDERRKNDPFYLWGFFRDLRRQRFDAVLDLFGNLRTALLSYFSKAPVRVGFEMRGRAWAYNVIAKPSSPVLPSGRRKVTEAYLDQARALGFIPEGEYRTSLFITDGEKDQARKILEMGKLEPGEKYAVLAPGASWPAKRWPLERYLDLGRILHSEQVRPLFIFGPKETELAREFESQIEEGWLYVNQPSIRMLMAFIQSAALLIANDAAPMHVGPAVGTPTLGIFGPGEPEIWFPYASPHQSVRADVDCGHCSLDQCPIMACMELLTVDQMAEKALQMIG